MPAKGGKTETIRKRTVWVYVPTEEHRRKWEKLAGKAGLSLSRWMLSVGEGHGRGAGGGERGAGRGEQAPLRREEDGARTRREARGRGAPLPRGAVPQRPGGAKGEAVREGPDRAPSLRRRLGFQRSARQAANPPDGYAGRSGNKPPAREPPGVRARRSHAARLEVEGVTIVLALPRPTNASLLESFAEDAALRGLTRETLRAYLSYDGILSGFLESREKGFGDVDADLLKEVLRFVIARGVKAKTVRAHLRALSAMCDYLQYEGLLPANPVPPFRKRYLRDYKKRRGEDDGVRRLLTVEETRLLIGSTLDPRDRAMMLVLAKTGVRG